MRWGARRDAPRPVGVAGGGGGSGPRVAAAAFCVEHLVHGRPSPPTPWVPATASAAGACHLLRRGRPPPRRAWRQYGRTRRRRPPPSDSPPLCVPHRFRRRRRPSRRPRPRPRPPPSPSPSPPLPSHLDPRVGERWAGTGPLWPRWSPLTTAAATRGAVAWTRGARGCGGTVCQARAQCLPARAQRVGATEQTGAVPTEVFFFAVRGTRDAPPLPPPPSPLPAPPPSSMHATYLPMG